MKTWINKLFILSIFSLALVACEKDEERIVLKAGPAPVLSASTSNIVLDQANATDDAVSFTWGEADFGYSAAVTYTLQIDTAGNDFVRPATIPMGNSLEKSYTVEELNTLLTKLKYAPEEAHDVRVRVMASVSDKVSPVYSNPVTVNVTPYSTFVEPSFIYVPGDYQGWNPATAPSLISVESNGVYKGIISFNDANSLEFKLTAERSWDLNYGVGAEPGSLEQNGPNLTVPTKDSYMITADLNNFTWSSAKHSWGVIGSATPGGWDNDTNMKYINEEGVWKATIALSAGEIKFRFNDDWALNYGDSNPGNNLLNEGGDNIVISSAGTYDIVLDLENEDGTATYSITKI